MTESRLVVQTYGGVALVSLDRPSRRNALDDGLLLDELPALVRNLAADTAVRAVVITGRGQAFCAGADLDGCSGLRTRTPDEAEDFTRRTCEVPVMIRRQDKPWIAAVNGSAVGAGFGLAMACDLRIASPLARFRAPFITMGIGPDYGLSYFLPRAVGIERALDILMTARFVDAGEAERIGLVGSVDADPVAAAMATARVLAAQPPRALAVTRQAVYRAMELDLETAVLVEEARHQAITLHGTEFKQAYGAYLERLRGPAPASPG